jgi:small nuclear ribonucleoprotein (snRNP)-like protein
MHRESELKNVAISNPNKNTHPYYSRLNALIGKKIVVTFNGYELEGVLLGFDSQHLNLCLQVNGKIVFVRGNTYLWFSEGVKDDVGS